MSHKNHDPKHGNHGCPMAAAHRGENENRGERAGENGHRSDGTSRRTFLAGAGAVALGVAAGCGKKSAGGGAGGGADKGMAGKSMAGKGMAEKGMAPAERRVAMRRAAARPAERAFQVPSSVAGRGQVFQAVWGTSLKGKNELPPREPVEKMVDHLLKELTGKSKPLDAWASLFSPSDIVAVKPNTLGRDWCSPSPAMISVIVERLRGIGVKPENIYVWDRLHLAETKLYAWLKAGKGYKGELVGVKAGLQSSFGFEKGEVRISTGQKEHLDKVITGATAVVNVPVWKDHGLAGVTGALKNVAFGIMKRARAFHPNACTPAIGDFYNLPMVGPKVRLILADVHRAVYEGGPNPRGGRNNVWLNQVFAARDPVALDRLQWQELDRLRKAHGMKLLMERNGKGVKRGTPIHVGHAAKLGLGEPELAKIRVTKKTFGRG